MATREVEDVGALLLCAVTAAAVVVMKQRRRRRTRSACVGLEILISRDKQGAHHHPVLKLDDGGFRYCLFLE